MQTKISKILSSFLKGKFLLSGKSAPLGFTRRPIPNKRESGRGRTFAGLKSLLLPHHPKKLTLLFSRFKPVLSGLLILTLTLTSVFIYTQNASVHKGSLQRLKVLKQRIEHHNQREIDNSLLTSLFSPPSAQAATPGDQSQEEKPSLFQRILNFFRSSGKNTVRTPEQTTNPRYIISEAEQIPEGVGGELSLPSPDLILSETQETPSSNTDQITLAYVTAQGASTTQDLSFQGGVSFGSGIQVSELAEFEKSADIRERLTVGTLATFEGDTLTQQDATVYGSATVNQDLTVGTQDFYVDTETDRVGIGTKYPQQKLDVAGNLKVGKNLLVVDEAHLYNNLLVDGYTVLTGILNANGGIEVDGDRFIVDGKTGDVTTKGSLTVEGQTNLSSNLNLAGSFLPGADNTHSLGSTSYLWKNLYLGGELYLGTLSSSSSTTEGTLYYDTDDDQLKVYANGKWQADRSTATLIVAANDSQDKEKADYVCDGEDDQVQIQAAIDALPSGGGKVQLLEGEYIITDSLVPSSNRQITGLGNGTLINATGLGAGQAAFELSTTSVTDLVIEKLRIRGPSTNYDPGSPPAQATGTGIYISTTSLNERFVARDLQIERCQTGIWLTDSNSSLQYFSIHDNIFEANSRSGIFVSGAEHGIIANNIVDGDRTGIGDEATGDLGIWVTEGSNAYATEYVSIIGNSIKSVALEAINCSARRCTITGNVINSNGQTGISLETVGGSPTSGQGCWNTVVGNYVKGTSNSGIVVRHDIVNNTQSGKFNTIVGNTIDSCSGIGIRVGQSGAISTPEGCIVADNNIYDTGGAAISLYDAIDCSVSGNKISGSSATSIQIAGASKRISVEGGQIESSAMDGITISGSSQNIMISNVLITNAARYGIRPISAATDISIIGCVFIDDQDTPTMDSAIAPGAGSGTLIVRNNISKNTTGLAYNFNSAGNLIASGNIADDTLSISSFTNGDTTPSVKANAIFKTANSSSTTITMFDDGVEGKEITVIINDSNTIIDFTDTNLKGNGGADWSPAQGDHIECVFDGTNWYCNISDNTA